MRKITSVNDFFDTMDGLTNGAFVSIGYVTKANIDFPMVKRKNPETNRMKNYPDYETFSKNFNSEEKLIGVIKFTRYLVNWTHRDKLNKQYGEYKNKVNSLRNQFGIDDMGKGPNYKEKIDYGNNGINSYTGNNDEKQGNVYYAQNVAKAQKVDKYYLIKEDGSIYRECDKSELIQFFKGKPKHISGLSALQKLTQDSAVIESYIQQMKEIDSTMSYRSFEASSIVYMVGTSKNSTGDKDKFIFLNQNLRDVIGGKDGIKIKPNEFINISRENYKIDLGNMDNIISEMRKRKVTLTESDIYDIVVETCNRILSEKRLNE